MEEMFLHAWDELDDMLGLCRHVATAAATEMLASSTPFIASVSGALLAGAGTLWLAFGHVAAFST
jgi:hypothetical protein